MMVANWPVMNITPPCFLYFLFPATSLTDKTTDSYPYKNTEYVCVVTYIFNFNTEEKT